MKNKHTTTTKIEAYLNLKKGVVEQNLHINSTAKKIMLATLPCITLGFGNINTLNAATSTRVIGSTVSILGTIDGSSASIPIDIDGNAVNDIKFRINNNGMYGKAAGIDIHIGQTSAPSGWFQRFTYGNAIGTAGAFKILLAADEFQGITAKSTACTAPWFTVGNSFLGVKFLISGNLHLGWLALEITDKKDANSDMCPGTSNIAGRKIKIIKSGWNTTSIAGGGTTITTAALGSLPVELLSFKAKVANKQIQLQWSTASENDNAGFEIERSIDGKKYETLSFVEGIGNTSETQEYFYEDKDLVARQLYYYRLKQIDYDGRFEYSKVITARLEGGNAQMGNFYPNPSKDGQTRLNYAATKAGALQVEVFDVSGKQLTTMQRTVAKGSNTLDFDFAAIGKGLFFIKIEQDGDSNYQKLILE